MRNIWKTPFCKICPESRLERPTLVDVMGDKSVDVIVNERCWEIGKSMDIAGAAVWPAGSVNEIREVIIERCNHLKRFK